MGLTFSLTSFACVGPFVGTLLAASVQGGGARPLAGMVSFATGLATPFFFLALFPSYLKRMPKSGGWLERVKVVMGFLILAAMFKYVSAVDQVMQWNLLTRERFLAAWIVLFAFPGLYLLGFLRLPGIRSDEPVGLGRLLAGAALLVFALSLAPGMFGARLGELDAYVPAIATDGSQWMKNQYREALEEARRQNKRVFVAFTGYACTNCHWMKANMFTRAGNRGGDERLRPAGALHRRHRCGLRGKPEAGGVQVLDGRDSLLCDRRPGREGGRNVPRPHARRRRVPPVPARRHPLAL